MPRRQRPFDAATSLFVAVFTGHYSLLLLCLPLVALFDFLFNQLEPLLHNSRLLPDVGPLISHLHLQLSEPASAVSR